MPVDDLRELSRNPLFRSSPHPTALIGPDLVIHGANPAYLAATGSTAEQLVGELMFDAFPDNPAAPEAHAVANLQASFEAVLERRQPDHMVVQRYDVPDRQHAGRFVEKMWIPVNTPVTDGDELIGILHRVEEVTQIRGDLVSGLDPTVLAELGALARENRQLSEALLSRAAIDQAKGMVMLACACSADEAFSILAAVSMRANVRVADVAATLVDQPLSRDSLLDNIRSVLHPDRSADD